MSKKSLLKQLIVERQRAIREKHKGRAGSLFIRHLDCGSCNACERELMALLNPIYDAERWGIHFEASPRHADLLALTGPYVRSLNWVALRTLQAMPVPRIVAVGDCACKISEFENSYAISPYPEDIKKAIIKCIPGCPPEPEKILENLIEIAQMLSVSQ